MDIQFDPIDEVLEDFRQGRLVIVTDDANRENEGDLILAAEKATPELINFMIRYTSGVLCVPMEGKDLDRLELPLMTVRNTESMRTAYTISADAKEGVTTGISAADRSRTIRLLADPSTRVQDLVRPGHVFPLRYREGGVLRRAGHTEAAVDLARLAGLLPAGVLAEVVNDDGSMARLPDLIAFKQQHKLKICSIENLISYRRAREVLIEPLEVISLPTDYGDFRLHLYRSLIDDVHHLALVKGIISKGQPTLVRVHSECLTGDVFGSRRCDCGDQLHAALQHIDEAGSGVLVYMRQEGRGIGLAAKISAYKLQEQGLDTVEANEKLGFPVDLREYGTGAQILVDLGVRQIRLLTNNPKKVVGLEGYGLNIVEQLPIKAQANPHNARYLHTKRSKLGHLL
ncbi:MAG: bifunctional 3,4-dihydroxy-2-butanone-4-phosphate synthase/GTP cyclohydrolase II [Verrucomicrobia bacterium]|nr:bifunctional 3,4-dihydroxy-2-butanone-4-phosphate synthase/GTP cyclohydrolase II [Verrucomicrobiota bacterium]MBV8376886.1 bifunctional 3,4-dihydroxy-2-butanone-4-phosphate synthase/GTP cyclohydrolase II [Verrucomicrobiota bacterium]